MNSKKFVSKILEDNKDVVPFVFEEYSVGLPHREFLLVCFQLLRERPTNKALATMLWDYIRDTEKEVPDMIYEFAEDCYIALVIGTMSEEKRAAYSEKRTGPQRGKKYNGTIFAVSIKDRSIIPLTSSAQMKEHGFKPAFVYKCVNGAAFSHAGYVFIRDKQTLN